MIKVYPVPCRNLECFSRRLVQAISLEGWSWNTALLHWWDGAQVQIDGHAASLEKDCWLCKWSWKQMFWGQWPGILEPQAKETLEDKTFICVPLWFLSFFQYRQVPCIKSYLPCGIMVGVGMWKTCTFSSQWKAGGRPQSDTQKPVLVTSCSVVDGVYLKLSGSLNFLSSHFK